ncbi:MAG: ABC transporter permease [Chloroflexota bacterium]|nr:ABC transporter permease [Chloroflexota bacterium]
MNFFTTFFTAMDALNSNKLRSGLTLLGIIIGVSAVITLMAIGRGAQESITSRIESLGTNLLFIRAGATNQFGFAGAQGSAANLTLEDSQALIDPILAPSVGSVAPETQLRGQLVYQRENTNTRLIGITPEYLLVRSFEVEEGQSITPTHISMAAQVIILGPDVVEDLFGLREPIGQTIRVNGRDFEVIGVMKSKGSGGFGNQDDQAYVPISTAYYRLGTQRTPQGEISVQTVNVQVRDDDATDAAVDEINSILRLRHRITDEDDFTITNQQETIEALEETTNTFVVFLGAIASISLLVGGIGIMNIMLVSVTERTREIGIRKAMGAKRRDILSQFLVEAVLLSLTGGFLGVALGLGLTQVLDGVKFGSTTFNTSFSTNIAVLSMAVSGGIGLFFGIYPAMQAAKLHPIEALRHE